MNQEISKRGVSVSGRRYQHFAETLVNKFGSGAEITDIDLATLSGLGIGAKQGVMDSAIALQSTANLGAPIQFLQTWLPGLVRVFQAPLTLDEAIGFTQVGSWEDAQIVQRWMERTGVAREYGDEQAKPLSNYNVNFKTASVVRLEAGIEVARLQEARATRYQVSDVDEKREGAQLVLRQLMEWIGWFGYNSGNNKTYGMANDPDLSAYVPVASTGTGSSPLWSTKTWNQRQDDLIAIFSALMTQTKGRVDPTKVETTMLVPVSIFPYFSSTNAYGSLTLNGWVRENYPLCRIMPTAKMDGINGGLNAIYLYADKITGADAGTDDGSTFRQLIPAQSISLGVEPKVGRYLEGFSCATAGTMALRPIAVYRASSI